MLTASTVCDALASTFPRDRVEAILQAMVSRGMIKAGRGAELSPHDAVVCTVAAAVPAQPAGMALSKAMAMRDWLCQGLQPGWKLANGVQIEDLKSIRFLRVACAEIYCRQPGPFWIAPNEIAARGLRFWPAGAGERLVRPEPHWVSLPQKILESFARHNGIVAENARRDNAALLGRIARSIKLDDTTTMTGAERNRRHRAKLVEAEAEAAE